MLSREHLLLIYTQANCFKEGDVILGGTKDPEIKEQARKELSNLTIGEISNISFVDDELTKALRSDIDEDALKRISKIKMSELKEILLSPNINDWLKENRMGLTSEVIAGLVKLMSNDELSKVSKSLHNEIKNEEIGNTGILIGSPNHFGSRIQPNSPGDDPNEILFHALEGLVNGCGDVIIGLNPSCDSVEEIVRSETLLGTLVKRLNLPTRFSVLSDMVKQSLAKNETKVDVGFQSLAGTSKALIGMLGVDVDGYAELCRNFEGLYFETGQGSEVTNHLDDGIDMVTLESRCYGLARYLKKKSNQKWMIVNDVSGFIGPEVYKYGDQLFRACLEDLVMAKMHGITMGLDVCSTFHMGINPFELEELTTKIAGTGEPAFLMAIAGKADPMLGYLTTAMKEHPRIRKAFNKKIASPMSKRLIELGIMDIDGNLINNTEDGIAELYALYMEAGLREENKEITKKIHEDFIQEAKNQILKMKSKGFDIGYSERGNINNTVEENQRLKNIYTNAVEALKAKVDNELMKEITENKCIFVQSKSIDRDQYIEHPETGEELNNDSIKIINELINSDNNNNSQVLFVISDGLNANAINSHVGHILPKIKEELIKDGIKFCSKDVIVLNGRVRLGYQMGDISNVEMIVHFIGERPGTGIDQMSAYITYGREGNEKNPKRKWNQQMEHCLTSLISGINPKGKGYIEATNEIIEIIKKGLKYKITGVDLSKYIK